MRREYDSGDGEFATAVAASVFAIHSREENLRDLRIESGVPLSKVKTRRNEHSRPAAASSTRPHGQDNKASSSSGSAASNMKDQRQQANRMRHRNAESETDAWEKSEMGKIKKRYEKMHADVLAWENKKKEKVEHQLEKKKIQMAHERDRILQRYQVKLAEIDHIARGAKQQVEQKRRSEESALQICLICLEATSTATCDAPKVFNKPELLQLPTTGEHMCFFSTLFSIDGLHPRGKK